MFKIKFRNDDKYSLPEEIDLTSNLIFPENVLVKFSRKWYKILNVEYIDFDNNTICYNVICFGYLRPT